MCCVFQVTCVLITKLLFYRHDDYSILSTMIYIFKKYHVSYVECEFVPRSLLNVFPHFKKIFCYCHLNSLESQYILPAITNALRLRAPWPMATTLPTAMATLTHLRDHRAHRYHSCLQLIISILMSQGPSLDEMSLAMSPPATPEAKGR